MPSADELVNKPLRLLGAVPEEEDASGALLGSQHPLTRALALMRTLARQFLVTASALLVSVLAVATGMKHADELLAATLVVGLGIAAVLVLARLAVRDRVLALLAASVDTVPLAVVQRERKRLLSRRERERLAASLEDLHRDARKPHFRPLPGVSNLGLLPNEVSAVARLLRSDRACFWRGDRGRVRGIALVSRLLTDGCESPLYAGDLAALREELNRIRYLLEGSTHAAPPTQSLAA